MVRYRPRYPSVCWLVGALVALGCFAVQVRPLLAQDAAGESDRTAQLVEPLDDDDDDDDDDDSGASADGESHADNGSQPLPGRGTSGPRNAGDVFVTASRWEVREQHTPRTTWMGDRDTIRKRQAAFNMPQIFADAAGVGMQATARWMGSPYFRGLTAYHNLVMIDGIRFNNSIFRSGPNQYWGTIDAQMVDRAEVVYGPGSVLYGSDAVGATVNLITLRWNPEITAPQNRIYTRASMAERSLIGHYDLVTPLWDGAGLVVGFTFNRFENMIGGDGQKLEYTKFGGYAANLRFTQMLAEDLAIDLIVNGDVLLDGPRTHSTNHAVPFAGTVAGSDIAREFDHTRILAAVQLRHDAPGPWYDRMLASLSWHGQYEVEFRHRSNGTRNFQGFDVNTLGVWVQFENDLTDDNTLTYGLDVYFDVVESFRIDVNNAGVRTERLQGPAGDDATYLVVGLFAQDEWELGGGLVFISGARATLITTSIGEVQDPVTSNPISINETYFGGAGHLGLQWYYVDESHAYVTASVGYRAPNLSDLSRLDSARSNEVEVPSPGLDPEWFYQLELGTKLEIENLKLRAAAFITLLDGVIVRQPTGNMIGADFEVVKRNAGDGFTGGVQLDVEYYVIPEVGFFGAFGWTYGEIEGFPTSAPTTETEPLSKLPPMQGRVGVRYRLLATGADGEPYEQFWIEFFAVITHHATELSTADNRDAQRIPPGGTPAWHTLNLRLAWTPEPGYTIVAQLLNITDEKYRTHGSGTNEPGINVVLAFEWTF